ncbi:MAG: patatin-like phospholipase family protein [Alphaproteobacteria bacterium]
MNYKLGLLLFLTLFQLTANSFPTRYSCADLKFYKKLLETKKPGSLTSHPNCNASAIKSATKNPENEEFWKQEIEPVYITQFGHPSSLFQDCKDCVSSAPHHTRDSYQNKLESKDYIFVLSLDGGGVRGIIAAKILAHIAKETGRTIPEIFDIFVGTSTGGLIALFLNAPDDLGHPKYSAEDLVGLYTDLPKKIFSHPSLLRKVRGTGGVLTAKYSAKHYEEYLKTHFGNATLSQTINPVVVTSFDIERGTPFFFNTLNAVANHRDDYFLWQAARATSAAPTYFKPYTLFVGDEKKKLTDGGIGVNNPAAVGVTVAKDLMPNKKIYLVSIGTGVYLKKNKFYGSGTFGGGALSGLGRNFGTTIDALLNAPNTHTSETVKMLVEALGGKYLSLNPQLLKDVDLASTSKKDMSDLMAAAEQIIEGEPLNEFIAFVNAQKKLKRRNAVRGDRDFARWHRNVTSRANL